MYSAPFLLSLLHLSRLWRFLPLRPYDFSPLPSKIRTSLPFMIPSSNQGWFFLFCPLSNEHTPRPPFPSPPVLFFLEKASSHTCVQVALAFHLPYCSYHQVKSLFFPSHEAFQVSFSLPTLFLSMMTFESLFFPNTNVRRVRIGFFFLYSRSAEDLLFDIPSGFNGVLRTGTSITPPHRLTSIVTTASLCRLRQLLSLMRIFYVIYRAGIPYYPFFLFRVEGTKMWWTCLPPSLSAPYDLRFFSHTHLL